MAEGSKYLVVLITVHFSGFILLRILNRVNSLPWRCGKERIANVPNTGPAQDDYLRRNEIGRERKRRAIRLDAAIWSVAVNFQRLAGILAALSAFLAALPIVYLHPLIPQIARAEI